jgi:type I restriction enzyme S subunit
MPEAWDQVTLGDVAHIQTGIAKGKSVEADAVSLPYLRVANVQDGHFDLSEIKTIEVPSTSVERYRLRAGDVLFTEGGDLDKLGRGDVWRGQIDPCLHQNHIFAVRPNKERLVPEFLAAVASSSYGRRYFLGCAKQTTNLASINSTHLRAFPIPLPPLVDQQRIAEILGSVDEAIRANSAVLHQASTLQRAIADRLVWGTAIRSEPLSACVKAITAGRSPEADGDPADHESWGVLKVSAIGFGKFFPRENKALTRDFMVDPRFRVREGDLLITRANTSALVGASCVVPQGTYRLMLSDKTLRLELSTGKVDANYLCIALLTTRVRRQISERASGTSGSMKNISQPSLLEIQVPLPAMDIQLKISDTMNSASVANENTQAQLDTLRRLKYGLLQALLSRELKVKGR